MPRASKVCSDPNCFRLLPCPEHTPKPWASSTRRSRLAKRSGSRQQKLRRHVLRRDNNTCHVCGQWFPDEKLVNDHVIPLSQGGADTVSNMAPCCTGSGSNRCHDRKTQAEARRGKDRGGA